MTGTAPAGIRLNSDRDLDIGLLTAAEMNRVIAAADAKAGLVLAAQGVVLAGLASAVRAGPPLPIALRLGAVAVLVTAGIAVVLLAGSLWPRWGTPAPAWFAFPALVLDENRAVPGRPAPAFLAEQAWAQAGELAVIARRKYRWFRAAIVVGAADLVIFTVWLALTSVL